MVKTREDLSEAEIACLEAYEAYEVYYRASPYNNRCRNAVEDVGKKIADSLKPKKWKPENKKFYFDSRDVYDSIKFTAMERHCHKLMEAQRRLKMERELNIINAYILEANEKDVYVADWNDYSQWKYSIYYAHINRDWKVKYTTYTQIAGLEVCSGETATKLCQMLNDGLIEGVAKHD